MGALLVATQIQKLIAVANNAFPLLFKKGFELCQILQDNGYRYPSGAGAPVAGACTPPDGVGVIGIGRIGVVVEGAAVKGCLLRRAGAHDDTVEGAVLEGDGVQIAPRRGVHLDIEAHHAVEGHVLEHHIAVAGNQHIDGSILQIVDGGIARGGAVDGAVFEHEGVFASLCRGRSIAVQLGAAQHHTLAGVAGTMLAVSDIAGYRVAKRDFHRIMLAGSLVGGDIRQRQTGVQGLVSCINEFFFSDTLYPMLRFLRRRKEPSSTYLSEK